MNGCSSSLHVTDAASAFGKFMTASATIYSIEKFKFQPLHSFKLKIKSFNFELKQQRISMQLGSRIFRLFPYSVK